MSKTVIAETVNSLHEAFKTHVTFSRDWREKQLRALIKMVQDEEQRLKEAVHTDLGKCNQEFYLTEYSFSLNEAKDALHNVSSWMKPQAVSTALFNMKGLSASSIAPTPLGVVLIIGAWNYPINLITGPLVGAIAAGNCVLIKPSELAPAVSKLFAEIIPKYMDSNCIKVIEGGVEETTEVLKQKFNHILYTGNSAVGKIIMKAAAEHLCPVTLELGGKNPTFVDRNADLKVTANRIAWAKYLNAGQTCLAVDYVLVQKEHEETVVNEIKKDINSFFGENPKNSPDYGRIINKRHVQRLKSYFQDIDKSCIVVGGPDAADEETKYFPPTVLRNVPDNAKIMQEEIFGPIMIIKSINNLDEGINIVNERPHPLALYIFSNDSSFKKKIIDNTQSGSVVVNDAMMQFVQSNLPFGGVGESGMGSYHGKNSFQTFSHMRSVLDKTTWFDLNFRYPPYSDGKLKQAKLFV